MHAIPNHVNSNFQIVHFLIGSCHTPDGAYALLCNLKESREMALAQLRAADLRVQAKYAKAKALQQSVNEWERLEAEADVAEIEDNRKFSQRNIDAAQKELAFIEQCMERLAPYRKFINLTEDEAHQAAQQDEWKFEMIRRAENYLLTTGSIPPDHYDTMRMHPAFLTDIAPQIQSLLTALKDHGHAFLLTHVEETDRKELDKPIKLFIENKGE